MLLFLFLTLDPESSSSVTTSSNGQIGGDDPTAVADGTITIGLSEGDAWDITINGGDCDGTTLNGTVAVQIVIQ